MKTVRVYELIVKEEAVHEYNQFVEVMYGDLERGFVHIGQEGSDKPTFCTKLERIPIQEFCEVIVPDHLKPRDRFGCNLDERKVDRTYIAIPKDLEKLLTVKWEAKVKEVEGKLFKTYTEVASLNNQLSKVETEVCSWWEQSWYKRVWLAIKGRKV